MKEFKELVEINKKLRSKNGCKWDRAQKIDNLKTYLLEEVYELFEAIDQKKPKKAQEEVGDIFSVLVFICRIFTEQKKFKVEDALKKINKKLVDRHPHVFSDVKVKDKEEVLKNWIANKAKSKKRTTVEQRLPKTAPALLMASIFLKEASYIGKSNSGKKKLNDFEKLSKKLVSGKFKKKELISLIIEISEIAAFYKLDLEQEVKKELLNRAKKLKYSEKSSKKR